jgi:hypothetical protein
MENYPVIAAFVIAELLGTLIYFKTQDSVKRTLLTCMGLGFAIAALISLLIPAGAVIPISENITKPLMALSAGVILCVVGSLLIAIISNYYNPEIPRGQFSEGSKLNLTKLSSVVFFGAIIAWISCLMA